LLVDAGHPDRALGLFRTVAVDSHGDAGNVTDAAWGFYMAGERGQASAVVTQALYMDPGYGNAYHLRGWISLVAGDLGDAASDFREAYDRTPPAQSAPGGEAIKGDVAALYYEGVAHQKAGRAQEAAAAWRGVVADSRETVQKAVSPLVRWQAEVLAALASARLGQPAKFPGPLEDNEVQSMLAEARMRAVLGERREALEALRQAISLGAGDRQLIRDDPDFDALRAMPEFVQMLQTFGRGPA
jgi:tetratricopeptide (TPR) repeat protein